MKRRETLKMQDKPSQPEKRKEPQRQTVRVREGGSVRVEQQEHDDVIVSKTRGHPRKDRDDL